MSVKVFVYKPDSRDSIKVRRYSKRVIKRMRRRFEKQLLDDTPKILTKGTTDDPRR